MSSATVPAGVPAGRRTRREANQLWLADAPVTWVDGGPVTRWMPVAGRYGRPLVPRGTQARYVVSRATEPVDPIVTEWAHHQRLLVTPPAGADSTGLSGRVFWRLVVRTRAFAIDALPCDSVDSAIGRVERLRSHAGQLGVMLGYMEGDTVPHWVLHDEGQPVFIGLPDFHLAAASDPMSSLASVVAGARLRRDVREIRGGGTAAGF